MIKTDKERIIGDLKDVIWWMKGRLSAEQNEDFCADHIDSLKRALNCVKEKKTAEEELETK